MMASMISGWLAQFTGAVTFENATNVIIDMIYDSSIPAANSTTYTSSSFPYNPGASGSITINVTSGSAGGTTPLKITATSYPTATLGQAYGPFQFQASGNPPYTWSWNGDTPPGMQLTSGGVMQGTPTDANFYTFTVTVKDSSGQTYTGNFDLTVHPNGTLSINTTPAPPQGTVGTTYGPFQFSAANGTQPYTSSWVPVTTSGGNTVPGLTLSSAGSLSGTPTTAGSYEALPAAHFKQACQARGIRARFADSRDHPIVASQLSFARNLSQGPGCHGVQTYHRAQAAGEEIAPIVEPGNVRQFVQQHMVEFAVAEMREQTRGDDRCGMPESRGHRRLNPLGNQQPHRPAYIAGRHPVLESVHQGIGSGMRAALELAEIDETQGDPAKLQEAEHYPDTHRDTEPVAFVELQRENRP